MTTYATLTGLLKATRDVIDTDLSSSIDNDREYQATNRKVKNLTAQLDALWSNPADVSDAAKAKNELLAAWHRATSD